MNLWYVVKTKPKKEVSVKSQLEKALVEVFLPKIKGLSARQTQRSEGSPFHLKPLFPSYLFVRSCLTEPHRHRLIRYTRGVHRILGDTAGPLPISDEVIEALKNRTRDGSLIEHDLLFKEGDQVRIKRGILKDLYGIIEKNLSSQGRVRILFKWLYGNMKASLWYTDLEKVA